MFLKTRKTKYDKYYKKKTKFSKYIYIFAKRVFIQIYTGTFEIIQLSTIINIQKWEYFFHYS